MGRVGTLGAAALLVLALSACTGGPPAPAQPSPTAAPTAGAVQSAAPVSLETGTDVGNGRPAVSHDGLMVRRRAVIAIHPAAGGKPGAPRARLEQTAAAGGIVLSDIPPDVLEPAILEHLAPELILALPPGSTRRRRRETGGARLRPGGQLPRSGACPRRLSPGPRPPVQRRCRRSGSPGRFHRQGRHPLGRARELRHVGGWRSPDGHVHGTTAQRLAGGIRAERHGPRRRGPASGRDAGSPSDDGGGSGHVPRTGTGGA